MSNRIEINKLKSYLKIKNGDSQAKQNKGRKVIRKGKVLTVCPIKQSRPHTGGGRRGPQRGHSERSERKLLRYLCACKPSDYFVSLTFPKPTGPVKAKKTMGRFLRNLGNNLPFEYGAVAKMELQPSTMGAEFMVQIWVEKGCCLEESKIQVHWDKVAGGPSRIDFRDTKQELWTAVSDYMSKEVRVTNDHVKIGSYVFPVRLNEGVFGSDGGDTLSLVTSPQYSAKHDVPKVIKVSKSLFDNWRFFTSQYVMKRNSKFIPKDSDNDGSGYISDQMDQELRDRINSTRKTFFLDKVQPYSIIMEDSTDTVFHNSFEQSNGSGDIIIDTDVDIKNSDTFNVYDDFIAKPIDNKAASIRSSIGLDKIIHYCHRAYNIVSVYFLNVVLKMFIQKE